MSAFKKGGFVNTLPTGPFSQLYDPSIAEGITRDGQKKLRELQAMLCPPHASSVERSDYDKQPVYAAR